MSARRWRSWRRIRALLALMGSALAPACSSVHRVGRPILGHLLPILLRLFLVEPLLALLLISSRHCAIRFAISAS